MTEYDAYVYDLDGTLVDLVVDWDRVAKEVASVLEVRGVDPPDELWDMLHLAEETGHRPTVEAVISAHEREGARVSPRLPAADLLPDHDVPVGVCSLNCEAACRVALKTHDLTDRVDAVVGRDSVATEKPNPEPLLATIRALGVDSGRVLFVGDSERDAVTAERAGVPYLSVEEWLAREEERA